VVARGVEQVFGLGIDVDGSWLRLIDELAAGGANAVRVLPNLTQLSTTDVKNILGRIVEYGMIFYVSPGDRSWFLRTDVQQMLSLYESHLIVDAFQEPNYDNPARWEQEAIAAVQGLRNAGYRVPLTVITNHYGRDLPTALARGPRVVAADPLRKTIIGWQAYWGKSGYYQDRYGMTLHEAMLAVRNASFPIQVGILTEADPGDMMDYSTVVTDAQDFGVGWLWWNWYNPFGTSVFNLSHNGTLSGLTNAGREVVVHHPASIQNTAALVCVDRK
jgi:hypothetical protein